MIAIDIGYLYALADADDRHHARAVAQLPTVAEGWITTWPVLTEACHLLARRLAPAAASSPPTGVTSAPTAGKAESPSRTCSKTDRGPAQAAASRPVNGTLPVAISHHITQSQANA